MKSTFSVARVALVSFFVSTGCLGFSSSKLVGINGRPHHGVQSLATKKRALLHPKLEQEKNRDQTALSQDTAFSGSNDGKSSIRRKPHTFVYRLNASTKWLVSVATTLGIWTRVSHYEGPFIVLGSILAVYFTDAIKPIINHDRPAGAPFTDPGMPSSHSLVSFFLAAAWTTLVLSSWTIASGLVWASASSVALLRVICGYHSWAQIGVGSLFGTTLGWSWAKLGHLLCAHGNAKVIFRVSWCFYILGSSLFIGTTMREWLHKDKHL